MIDVSEIGAFLGLDVGKGEHHATAVTPAGKKAFDKRLPNSEPKLREVFGKLQAKHGTVLVIVDQPASIGALPLAVARDMGCPVAYLPGLTMRRIADLYPGEAKTDARDAFVIVRGQRLVERHEAVGRGEDQDCAGAASDGVRGPAAQQVERSDVEVRGRDGDGRGELGSAARHHYDGAAAGGNACGVQGGVLRMEAGRARRGRRRARGRIRPPRPGG